MSEGRPARMTVEEILGQARDALTVKRVFGEPIERDGITVIPVAAVRGGGGGGGGGKGEEVGSGGGYGLAARPVGIYQIRGGEAAWLPAVDATRIAVLGQLLGLVALLVLRSLLRSRHRRP